MATAEDRWSWWAGLALNALVRASIVVFLVDALRHPDDLRYAGKAIPGRNLLVVGSLSMLFPAFYAWRRWPRYPVWYDTLYLSIFWVDMAGNAYNLYNRCTHFDLLPHAHGTGALAAVLRGAFGRSALSALGMSNAIHALLEAQEYVTDVVAGTHNVRGAWDTAGDMVAGLLGTALYVTACEARRPRHLRGRGEGSPNDINAITGTERPGEYATGPAYRRLSPRSWPGSRRRWP